MRARAWVVSLATAATVGFGAFGLGCGSVTPVETGTGGSGNSTGGAGKGGTAGGGAGAGGSTGGATGSAGSGGAAGSDAGGRGGGPDTAGGAGRGGTTGVGGSASGGRGGTTGTGGSTGSGGIVTTGGRGGGSSSAGTGGVATGGRGGTTGAGGAVGVGGVGGVATGGRGGSSNNGGTGGTGGTMCARGACPALAISDLEGIDDSKAPGFDAPGFRCKALTVCPPSGACVYYSTTAFGSLQSAEDTYTDGAKLTAPMAVHVVIEGGAASQCGNPAITFTADDYLTLTFDGGKKVPVYLPASTAASFSLYVATDGSTFTDAALTMPARLRPTP